MLVRIPLCAMLAAAALVPPAASRPQTPAAKAQGAGTVAVPAGEKDLRVQVLLDRSGFSVGQIDGNPGSNTSRAMAAYEKQRVGGAAVAQAGLHALTADNAPTLVDYTITAEDVKGPFVKVPVDMMAKSKLATLGYTSVAEKLGERFHCSPALLKSLNPGKRLDRAGETIRVPNVRTEIAAKAAKVVVDQSDGSVSAPPTALRRSASFRHPSRSPPSCCRAGPSSWSFTIGGTCRRPWTTSGPAARFW